HRTRKLGICQKGVELLQQNSIRGASRSDDFNIRTAQLRITPMHSIEYLDTHGKVRLTDSGPRIDLAEENDQQAMRAGLLLAAQKYGGEVYVTGSLAFRELVANEAVKMGIRLRNPELSQVSFDKQKIQPLEL
ncbi:MAG: hypothetical protein PSV24_01025, partial [Rhodoferax sp.]|nr:hypothetical protein [Rhodoferax sp.]